MRCGQCQQDNLPRAKFCRECGARLGATCGACGADLPEGAKFCSECGQPLATATRAPAPPAAPESYTPRHLAEKILTSRAALEGERKPVTVLFCDLISSTALAERLGPDAMHTVLNGFFERALGQVHRYEGTINQFLGDGFMALFGAPIAHEDHARRAVLAAVGIRRALAERPVVLGAGEPVPLVVRMGLHSGFVVVGAIGDNLRMDYTAVGDTTNLAARLQQMAAPGGILISDATARLVEGYVHLESRGGVEIRGKSERVVVHAVTGTGSRRSRVDAAHRPLSRFVGRERELATLVDLFAQVERGSGQVVGVVGEPGVGKSRLVMEFQRAVGADRATYLEGRCLSYGSAIPYLPVLDLLRAGCGIADADTPEAIDAKLRAALGALDLDAGERTPYLLHLLGVKTADDRLGVLGADAIMHRTFETLRQMSLRSSRRRPLIVVVEDLHWIDRTSEACLDSLVESLAGAPILLLGTYRPGYRPGWMDRSYATQLPLRPLAAPESLAVVRSLLPDVADADPRARLILDKAEGNPLFLEELAQVVDDRGATSGGLAVPETVHGVLLARIDRLPEIPKRILQTASVLGREFSVRVLEAIAGEPGGLRPHLLELSRLEFLYERTGGDEAVYIFKHALTQDVARATLVVPRRRDLHRRAAETLEALYPARAREMAPVLAHHYFEAEAWAEAARWAGRAADSARGAYANREAVARYDQALIAAERGGLDPAERIPLLEARADVHAILGDFDRARADLESALALAESSGDAPVLARVLWTLGALWGGHKDYQKGLDLTRRAAAVSESSRDGLALAEARARLGIMQLNLARMAESRRELEQALALFRARGDEGGQARVLEMLAMNAWMRGAVTEAEEHGGEALRKLEAIGDRATEQSALVTMGTVLGYRDGWAASEPWLRRAVDLALAIGARGAEAYARAATAESAIPFGLYGVAHREAVAALRIAREIGHREWTALALAVQGRALCACGDAVAARRLDEEMVATARELGTALWIADGLANLGEDCMLAGEAAEAARHLDEAIRVGGDGVKHVLRPLIARAELFHRAGEPGRALETARLAAAAAPEVRVLAVDARRVEGLALAALGRLDESERVLREAKVTAVALGIAPARWRVCLALARALREGGREAAARSEAEEALAALEGVAASLSDPALRRLFDESAPWWEARAFVVSSR